MQTVVPSLRALCPQRTACTYGACPGASLPEGLAGWRGQGSPDEAGLKRVGRALSSCGPRPPFSSPNQIRHPQQAPRQGLCAAPLLPPGSSEGTAGGPVGAGWRPSYASGCALRYPVPVALPFPIFSFFLPEPPLFGSVPAILGALCPFRPFPAAGQGRGVERLHPLNPRRSPAPPFPPPFRPRAGSGAGKGGRGHHVATPPEPAFSRAAAGGSPPAAQLASPGAHGSGPALRSASATPLPELRLQPARERALRAATPIPGSRLPAPGSRLSAPGSRSLWLGARPLTPRALAVPQALALLPARAPLSRCLSHPSAPAHSPLCLLLACSFASSQTRRSSFAGKSQKPLQKADNEI